MIILKLHNKTLKPEPTKRAQGIFQDAYIIENMDDKFGSSLSREENDVRMYILTQSPVLGRIPSINEIRRSFLQFPRKKVDAILEKLDQLDVIHLNDDNTSIVAAYPFSGTQTSHMVTLKREGFKRTYAMCAIDALGMCFMFNCDVSIESECCHCNDKVEIETRNNEIIAVEPNDVVVWCDREYSCCAATSCCPNINFFSSKLHFAEWREEKPGGKGELLDLKEAFYLGKLFFENRIEKNR